MTEDNTSGTGAQPGASEQANPQSPTTPGPSGGKALGLVALIFAIGAVSVSGYLWYQVQVEQRLSQNQLLVDIKDAVNTSKVETTALEKELEALRTRQAELAGRVEKALASRLAELENAQRGLAESNAALSNSVEQVYQELDRSLESWALEEVEQLLRIANHSLRLNDDVATALAGLELADKRLEEMGNPAFLSTRKRLAKDITALKSLDRVDIAGISLRLSGMAAKVEDLPLAQRTERPISGDRAEDDTGEAPSSWLKAGGELLGDLKKLVRIQNIDEPAKPLLTPEQRYFLFSNLRLMLSGAQIAALRQDTATYRENLERAGVWLEEYFDTDHDGVSQLVGEIDAMRDKELDPELPDISDSLDVLRQAKNRMKAQ